MYKAPKCNRKSNNINIREIIRRTKQSNNFTQKELYVYICYLQKIRG